MGYNLLDSGTVTEEEEGAEEDAAAEEDAGEGADAGAEDADAEEAVNAFRRSNTPGEVAAETSSFVNTSSFLKSLSYSSFPKILNLLSAYLGSLS
jgi:hypothetical protein